MSLEVFVLRIAPVTETLPLSAKLERLVDVDESGPSNVIVTVSKVEEPTALTILGGTREPESGKALISASVNESFVLKTNRSTNMPASRVPILKVNAVFASTSGWVTV